MTRFRRSIGAVVSSFARNDLSHVLVWTHTAWTTFCTVSLTDVGLIGTRFTATRGVCAYNRKKRITGV
jgi:hypothetical protein